MSGPGSSPVRSSLVLGVDSSTQSVKVELRRAEDGAIVATGRSPHPAATPPRSEQSPADWWRALVAACAQLGEARSKVGAVAVAAQQHGLVLLDDAGVALRPAPLWNDTTAAPAAATLVASLGARAWAQGCGSVPVASFTIAKLAQLHRSEPELLSRTTRVMLPHDYLTWRLCGAHVTDPGDASGTGWFDPARGRYRTDLLAAAVDDPDAWVARLPQVLASSAQAGRLTGEAAGELGMPPGVAVAAGTGDNMAAALGLGVAPGQVVISLGTSGTAYGVAEHPTADETGAVAGFASASRGFLPLVCTLNATRVTDTVAGWMGLHVDAFARLALDADPAPVEAVLVPYFDGERTPNRPDAAGLLSGLRTGTGRAELARVAHDGVLCGLLDGVDALRLAGLRVSGPPVLVGGGARSAAYRQRAADLWGTGIVVPEDDEVVATGAAVLAACALEGVSTRAVGDRWGLGGGAMVEPRPGAHPEEVRARYRAARDRPGASKLTALGAPGAGDLT
ncbi:MAG: xylulokinase [Microthrixaceae bacterium]